MKLFLQPRRSEWPRSHRGQRGVVHKMRPRVMRICGTIIVIEAMGLNVPPFNPTEWPRNARDFHRKSHDAQGGSRHYANLG